jgi:hypothetical protein
MGRSKLKRRQMMILQIGEIFEENWHRKNWRLLSQNSPCTFCREYVYMVIYPLCNNARYMYVAVLGHLRNENELNKLKISFFEILLKFLQE